MARQARRRTARPRPTIPGFGAHWRADGRPKTAYGSQAEALSVAEEQQRFSGTDLSVYQCDFCHAWHMGGRGGREYQ